ncbi:Transcriptional regulatory protein [Wickerhamomyces ciferrii]|uniref:Transcriptional regulatory protein n=1 Tax=Wickerhamomyces ciferrii (strain ATCC 14091 / BCRC 22168 / CBS 111 / JCM 3599 / NBRC 0793 / NRRL Y-1031 F-60-10) TaxID=1206466 RepID=K0KVL1_WICCF|nr:Transcriptional regulatory protein [Wickerhamomyces ciferrii]CCH45977.1 Transcriptional regulatory protein [Wickerhamomyces ciferrii]
MLDLLYGVGNIEDQGKINGETTNRGNKLKLGSNKVHRDRINGYNNDNEPEEQVHYNHSKRSIVKRRRLDTYVYDYNPTDLLNSTTSTNGQEHLEIDEDDDPYHQIDIEKILAPISHPSDIVTRSSLSRTYNSDVLKKLAQQAIETIEREQNNVIQLSKLLDTLLGEDCGPLLEAQLLLPEYNHNLTSINQEEETPEQTQQQQQQQLENQEEPQIDILDKRITRRQSTQETDPFFALPQLKFDSNFGLNPEDAEEARQLSQISLQRSEELIRNLTTLRNGLVRAETLKSKILQWSKEINGDPDESDLYQDEKEAAQAANPQPPSSSSSSVNSNKDKDKTPSRTSTPEVRTSGRPRRSAM